MTLVQGDNITCYLGNLTGFVCQRLRHVPLFPVGIFQNGLPNPREKYAWTLVKASARAIPSIEIASAPTSSLDLAS